MCSSMNSNADSVCFYLVQQLLYRIVLSINGTGKCTVSKIDVPFKPAEVPRDAKFATEAYIGGSLPGIGVLVNMFYGEVQRKDVKGKSCKTR